MEAPFNIFWENCTSWVRKNSRPGENCMWGNHITASLTAVCILLVPVQWVYIGMQEHVYWICNQKQKCEEWRGKLLPAATSCTYLRRFSPRLNYKRLMSSPPNWWFFKHARGFVQHSTVEHLCQAETAFKANVLKGHAYLVLLITTKKTNVPHQVHCYLCN